MWSPTSHVQYTKTSRSTRSTFWTTKTGALSSAPSYQSPFVSLVGLSTSILPGHTTSLVSWLLHQWCQLPCLLHGPELQQQVKNLQVSLWSYIIYNAVDTTFPIVKFWKTYHNQDYGLYALDLGVICGVVGGCMAGMISWLSFASTYPGEVL